MSDTRRYMSSCQQYYQDVVFIEKDKRVPSTVTSEMLVVGEVIKIKHASVLFTDLCL